MVNERQRGSGQTNPTDWPPCIRLCISEKRKQSLAAESLSNGFLDRVATMSGDIMLWLLLLDIVISTSTILRCVTPRQARYLELILNVSLCTILRLVAGVWSWPTRLNEREIKL